MEKPTATATLPDRIEGSEMAFAAFAVLIFIWFCLHLVAAQRAWQRLQSEDPSEINGQFMRSERFFAREARAGRIRVEKRFSGQAELSGQSVTAGVIADGRLTLLEGARVNGFADSNGAMEVRGQSVVDGRATSCTAIRLRPGARVRVCNAPEITTDPAGTDEINYPERPAVEKHVHLPSDADCLHLKMERLGADTWICRGDITIENSVILDASLSVTGLFSIGPGSRLNADVKASGDVRIGAGSICGARVISGGNMELGAGCRFEKILYSGGDLYLGEGVYGEAAEPVVAWGARRVLVARGVYVSGKLSAGEEVLALP